MEKENKTMKKALDVLKENSSALIITNKDGLCGAALRGDVEEVAQALFTCMHDKDSEVSEHLYRILKLNVMNILNNPSKYKLDLLNLILNLARNRNEQV